MRQAVRPATTAGDPFAPAGHGVGAGAPIAARLRGWAAGPLGTATLLVALVAVSLAIRLEGQRMWFWIDEGLSAGIASHPLRAIPGVLRQDGSPPLYYVLLHGWIRAFGSGEVALHAFSLVFALACVPAALWAGWSLFGRRVGWTAAVLAATNTFLTYYGREARMYTLVAFLALLATACFVHAFAFGRRRYLAPLAVLVALLLYTHTWSLYFVAGAAVALVPCLAAPRARDARRRVVRDALVTFGAAGVAFLPWVPTLLSQVAHTGAPWSRVPTLREAVSELDAVVSDERVLVILLLVGGAGLATFLGRGRWRTPDGAAVLALVTLAVVPLALSWTTSQFQPNWATRYFAMIVGAILLVAALGLARAGTQGVAALVLILLFWTQPLGRLTGARPAIPLDQKSNVKAVAASLRAQLRPGDLVVATHAEQTPVLHYYLPSWVRFATPTGPVADPGVFDWRDVVRRTEAATPAADLTPLVDRLAAGAHVVLVGPVGALSGDRDPTWFTLFHRRTDEWLAALRADRRLRPVAQVGSPDAAIPGTSVWAVVFVKTAA